MKSINPLSSLFLALLITALLWSTSLAVAQTNNSLKPLVAGNTAFGLDLYAQLKATEGNLFFSPYSISTCLAMTYAGARGGTEKQMAQVLHFGNNQDKVQALFGTLQNQLNEAQKKQEIQLNVANGLWAQKGHPFLSAFLDIARKQYDANVNQVDFRTSAGPARNEINDWVSQKTKGKITNLIPQGMLNPMTRLVLVNAIYFKGRWSTQFKKGSTTNAPFSVTGDRKMQVPLMNITENFNYAEPEGLQVLELPYVGNDVSMVVLLSRENNGLKTLENSLSVPKLYEWLTQLHSQKVNVFLPKFKLTDQFSLAKTLAAMGMTAPFSPQADFSGMDGGHDLFISDVVHKAYVDVNEEGTEAAAATSVGMRALAVRRPASIPVFRADHPFIFLIRDTHTDSILFLGRLLDPTK